MVKKFFARMADLLDRLVADRPAHPSPSANFIPNSDGNGGTVISTNYGAR